MSLFIYWPKCSTCRRALEFLRSNNIEVELRDIMTDNPTKEELKSWFAESGLPIKRFFNTSGFVYREMGLKDKLDTMTEEEQFDLLATTGRLVRRPILIGDHGIFIGFHLEMYQTLLP